MVSQGVESLVDRLLKAFMALPALGKVEVIVIGLAALWVIYRIWRGIDNFIHRHRSRKRIFKAAEALEKSVGGAVKETADYRASLQAFIDQYDADNGRLSPAFETFKLQITRFSLPKIDPEKFKVIRDLCYVNLDSRSHYAAFYNAVMLGGFCNIYREFFAQDNWRHLAAIEALIGSRYHTSSLKPHAEYIAEKVPDRDADQAMRYFATYARLVDDALARAESLQRDLKYVKSQNGYWAILTVGI